jgi:hypothetical protein
MGHWIAEREDSHEQSLQLCRSQKLYNMFSSSLIPIIPSPLSFFPSEFRYGPPPPSFNRFNLFNPFND